MGEAFRYGLAPREDRVDVGRGEMRPRREVERNGIGRSWRLKGRQGGGTRKDELRLCRVVGVHSWSVAEVGATTDGRAAATERPAAGLHLVV